jgi:DNA (cytosine-5)-methyltransferase 1
MNCIDLFAGAGGFSTGAILAGCKVIFAANHWKAAIETHSRNHPDTQHLLQDLCQADFTQFPKHDVLLASPACQGHSKARGKERPHHDSCRSTAWAVISCAEVHRPAFVIVENVPEFLKWKMYPSWHHALKTLGYNITEYLLDAADFGIPQSRRRIFIVATRKRIQLDLHTPSLFRVPAREIIQWEHGDWSEVLARHRSLRTLQRIKAARQQFGKRFLIAYYGNEQGGRSLDVPLGTVTTRDRFAVIDAERMRMLSIAEYRTAMGFPESYWLPANHRTALHLLGNAVCPPLASEILTQVKAAA